MNYQETEILGEMKFLNRDQRSDVLHFIEKLKKNHRRKVYRRQAMMQIRKALSGQS